MSLVLVLLSVLGCASEPVPPTEGAATPPTAAPTPTPEPAAASTTREVSHPTEPGVESFGQPTALALGGATILPNGTRVRVLHAADENGWVEVTVEGTGSTGFVQQKYIRPLAPARQAPAKGEVRKVVHPTAPGVESFGQPTALALGGATILPNGTRVRVLNPADENGWVEVTVEETGSTGFVQEKWLE